MASILKNLCSKVAKEKDKRVFEIYPDLDQLYDDPVQAWKERSKTQTIDKLKPIDANRPIREDCVRFVCISDTHDRLEVMMERDRIPNGDVLLHTGDITLDGEPEWIVTFNKLLGTLPHKVKLVLAGNHDYCLDRAYINLFSDTDYIPELGMFKNDLINYVKQHSQSDSTDVYRLLTNCVYLEDNMVEVYGIKIYGTPWVVRHTKCIALSLKRGVPLLDKWNKIPSQTNILMTHSPPLGYGDICHRGSHTGCVDLLNTVQKRVQPNYHVFGHIHEGYGIYTDGVTKFINAASCTKHYGASNLPIVFDFPLPSGHSKRDMVNILTDIGKPIDYKEKFISNPVPCDTEIFETSH